MPTSLGARITDAQENALLKALAVQPVDRYQSIAEFRAALTTAQPKPPKPEPPKPQPKRLRIVLSVLLLLLLGFGVLFCWGHDTYYENDTGITVTGYKNIFELDVREYIPGKLTIPKILYPFGAEAAREKQLFCRKGIPGSKMPPQRGVPVDEWQKNPSVLI